MICYLPLNIIDCRQLDKIKLLIEFKKIKNNNYKIKNNMNKRENSRESKEKKKLKIN